MNQGLKVYDEIYTLRDFKPWSYANYGYNKIIDAGKDEEFIAQLADAYPEGISASSLNDFLWHDTDTCFRLLGLNSEGEEPAEASDIASCGVIQKAIEDTIEYYFGNYPEFDRKEIDMDESDFEYEVEKWVEWRNRSEQFHSSDPEEAAKEWLQYEGTSLIESEVEERFDQYKDDLEAQERSNPEL